MGGLQVDNFSRLLGVSAPNVHSMLDMGIDGLLRSRSEGPGRGVCPSTPDLGQSAREPRTCTSLGLLKQDSYSTGVYSTLVRSTVHGYATTGGRKSLCHHTASNNVAHARAGHMDAGVRTP